MTDKPWFAAVILLLWWLDKARSRKPRPGRLAALAPHFIEDDTIEGLARVAPVAHRAA